MDRVTHALGWARPDDATPLAVLLLDLDRFKVINESLGHAVGDQLLAAVGRRLSDALRPADTIARLGGDEFAVLVDGLAGDAAAEGLARRMVDSLAAPFLVEGRETYVSASIGVALSRAGAHSAADLLREAEIALYRAKDDAGDRVSVFHPRMSASSMDRLELELDLRRAIERDELRVHYQPLVDLRTGRTVGHEALRPLAASDPRPPAAAVVHPARRGERPHPADRRRGPGGGLPPGASLAARRIRPSPTWS